MLKIGLTGNMGSGKSTVSKLFEPLGFKVFDMDIIAKDLYHIPEVTRKAEKILNISIQLPNGNINYPAIAEKYFNNRDIYVSLNEVLFDVLREKTKCIINENLNNNIIIEAAMLFEIGLQQYFDHIIVVSASLEERMDRVFKRNGWSREKFLERENNQLAQDYKEAHANYIIYNDTHSSVTMQVNNIIDKLLLNKKI